MEHNLTILALNKTAGDLSLKDEVYNLAISLIF